MTIGRITSSASLPLVVILAVTSFLLACGDNPGRDPAEPILPDAPAALGRSAEIPEWLDTDFVKLAGVIPGYGGHYFQRDGTTILYLSDAANRANALHTLRAALNSDFRGKTVALNGRIEIKAADFEFMDLTRWRLKAGRLLARKGMLSLLGTDKAANRIVVGVRNASYLSLVHDQLVAAGIPSEALDLREVSLDDAKIVPEDGGGGGGGGSTTSSPNLSEYATSLLGGYQIATEMNIDHKKGACTLGAVGDGKGFATAPYTALHHNYAVTVSHCTPSYFEADLGIDFYQPVDDFIGWELADGFPQEQTRPFAVSGLHAVMQIW